MLVSNPILKAEETFNKDHSLQEHENRLKPTCRKLRHQTPSLGVVWTLEIWESKVQPPMKKIPMWYRLALALHITLSSHVLEGQVTARALQTGHFSEMGVEIKLAFNVPVMVTCVTLLCFPTGLLSSRDNLRALNGAETSTVPHTNLFVVHSGFAKMPCPPLVSQSPHSVASTPPSPYVPPAHIVRLELPQSP